MDFANSESDPSTNDETNRVEEEQVREEGKSNVHTGNGASPGKIFIGGLAKETSLATFNKYFGKYGEITDSVIMKDRRTGHPRGFGFVTYADPSVVDKVIEETHVINGKQVEIKRTIPKGAISGKDFKTKKIFVGGIPTSVDEDEFKDFFQKFGEVTEHQIMRDHSSNRSRGFGFVTFESEKAVDDLLSKGNRLDFSGTQVEIKKAEPKKSSSGPPTKHFGDHRPQFGGSFGPYGDFGGGFGNSSYRAGGNFGRTGDYGGGYGGGYGGNGLGSFRDSSLSYSGRYGGGISRNYDLGGYGGINEGGYGGYGGAGYGSGYESAYGTGYGGTGGSVYGGRGGYGGAAGSRYHPYTR